MLVETLVQQNRPKEAGPCAPALCELSDLINLSFAERFLSAWKANPFRGNKELRKQVHST